MPEAAVPQPFREIGALTAREFALFRDLIYSLAGIALSDGKQVLVSGRLMRRLKELGLTSYGDYYRLVTSGQHADEQQRMVDLLTTNETYFFREPKHFEYLRDKILPGTPLQPPFRVWSAACSSGEEPYTLSMVLAGAVGNLIDRALLGYVTDMFETLFMRFAVFNVADICVVVGGIAFCVYYLFFHGKEEGHGADSAAG